MKTLRGQKRGALTGRAAPSYSSYKKGKVIGTHGRRCALSHTIVIAQASERVQSAHIITQLQAFESMIVHIHQNPEEATKQPFIFSFGSSIRGRWIHSRPWEGSHIWCFSFPAHDWHQHSHISQAWPMKPEQKLGWCMGGWGGNMEKVFLAHKRDAWIRTSFLKKNFYLNSI